jgi:hypothetical protein
MATVALACGIFARPASAAILAMDSATLIGGADTDDDGDADEPASITAFVAGGTEYFVLETSGDVRDAAGTRYWTPGDDPGTDELALEGAVVTDGVLNGNGMTFMFSRAVTAADRLFLTDINNGPDSSDLSDDPTLVPVDINGDAIGDFSMVLDGGDQAYPSLLDLDVDRDSGSSLDNFAVLGNTWTLDDFVGTGTLSGVYGVKVTDDDGIDIGAVGLAQVPEPASLALIGAAGLLVARRLRGPGGRAGAADDP